MLDVFDPAWFRWLCIVLAMVFSCRILGAVDCLIRSVARRNEALARAIEETDSRQDEAVGALKALIERAERPGTPPVFGGLGN